MASYAGGNVLTKSCMGLSRTQFYGGDGTGRDSYIYQNNGGFCSMGQTTGVEELGTFYNCKQRPREHMPSIPSKGVNYINNGLGRDTYISSTAGGFRSMYAPAAFKRTFYNNLRVYPKPSQQSRVRSHTATAKERRDFFTQNQQHFNDKFNKEVQMIKNYQNNLDARLSRPKQIQQNHKGKFTKNSVLNRGYQNSFNDQGNFGRATTPFNAVNQYTRYSK